VKTRPLGDRLMGNLPEQVKKFYLDPGKKMAYNIAIVGSGIAVSLLSLLDEANPRILNCSMHAKPRPSAVKLFPEYTAKVSGLA
jgi:hypothetical protein